MKSKFGFGKIIEEIPYRIGRMWGRDDYTRFIILSRSRTGSNLLNNFIGNHPAVRVKGELFGWLKGEPFEKKASVIFSKQPNYIKAAGCKVFYYHPHDGNTDELFSFLHNVPNLKIIHLKRRNTLRTVLSWLIAQENGKYIKTAKDTQESPEDRKIHVEKDDLVARIKETQEWEKWGDRFFEDFDVLSVFYEDLINDADGQYNLVTDFLSIARYNPRTYLKRQNPEPVEDLIMNLNEIKLALEDIQLGHLLN